MGFIFLTFLLLIQFGFVLGLIYGDIQHIRETQRAARALMQQHRNGGF